MRSRHLAGAKASKYPRPVRFPATGSKPVSEPASRLGVEGAAGAAASTVTDSAEDATEVLPAASVAVAVMLWVPADSADTVML